MDRFYGLLEGERNQQTNANRCDVNQEVFPSTDGFVGSVYIKHGFGVLRSGKCFCIGRRLKPLTTRGYVRKSGFSAIGHSRARVSVSLSVPQAVADCFQAM